MNDPKGTYPSASPENDAPDAREPREPGYSNIYNPQHRGPEMQQQPYQQYPPAGGYRAGAPYGQQQPPQGGYRQPQPDYRQPRDYRYGGYEQQPPRYDPYQYSPSSGWQQKAAPPPKPEPEYEWKLSDYDGYDDGDKKRPRKKKGHGFVIFSICLLLALSVGLISVTAFTLLQLDDGDVAVSGTPAEESSSTQASVSEEPAASSGAAVHLNLASKPQLAPSSTIDGRLTIPDVAEKVTPSVVSVIKYVNSQFMEPAGIGSGIIISEDGYIVTNAHVVSGGTDFKVHLYNGDPFDADVIGYDTATDLAVLKVHTEGLIPAQFGDSSQLRVGETVIAIGNPVNLNFAGSVTQGIVSALNRKVDNTRYSINYIQTDAAINPGNSGGALANEFGQVIGINVAKIAATGYEGMGFAIPMSEARPIIEDLLQFGRVTGRVKLGIEGYSVDEFDAKRYEWKPGVMIQSIDPNSDLIGKDVQKGDIITHVNGERIYMVTEIHTLLDGCQVGDTITLTIYRKLNTTQYKEFDVEVALVEDAG